MVGSEPPRIKPCRQNLPLPLPVPSPCGPLPPVAGGSAQLLLSLGVSPT